MRHLSGFLRASLSGLAVLALSAAVLGNPDTHSRVTIRGRGTNVVIEGDRARFPPRTDAGRHALAEAARLKRSGEDDAAVIAYLRGRQLDLPSVIDAADVARLRRAGAGKAVIAYLGSVAAIDIGPTGEGSPTAVNESIEPMELEAPPYAMPYGYPVYSSVPYGFGHRVRPHGGFHAHPARPIPLRPISPRLMFPRFPSMRGELPRFPLQ